MAYDFRRLVAGDLEQVGTWLREPGVARWFPDADYVEDLEDHLDDPRIVQEIVSRNGAPFAWLQTYDIHGWEDHPLGFLPPGSRGMDTLIGVPEMRGQGHGAGYVRQKVERLFADGVPAVGIDPHPDNAAAIAAYRRAGFVVDGKQDTEWGPVVLMSCLAPNTL